MGRVLLRRFDHLHGPNRWHLVVIPLDRIATWCGLMGLIPKQAKGKQNESDRKTPD